jgi:hypothetical protein
LLFCRCNKTLTASFRLNTTISLQRAFELLDVESFLTSVSRFQRVMHSVLSCRILLNVREADRTRYVHSGIFKSYTTLTFSREEKQWYYLDETVCVVINVMFPLSMISGCWVNKYTTGTFAQGCTISATSRINTGSAHCSNLL